MTDGPDFIVIGAAKCGTTSLCDDLARHPGVFISSPKEPEYFCRDENYAKGTEWYRSLFSGRTPGQIAGEGSTMYSNCEQFPHAVGRMARDLPGVKLVYIMREPVARAYSHWVQEQKTDANLKRDSGIPRVFEDAIRQRPHYVSCGDYRLQLTRYLDAFPRDRLHLIVFEEYVADRAGVLGGLCRFLGVDPEGVTALEPVWSNNSERFFATAARVSLAAHLNAVPGAGPLKRLVPRPARRAALRAAVDTPLGRALIERRKPRPMLPQTRAQLKSRYAPAIDWVESLLGRPVDAWRMSDGPRPARA